jgi:hypothetical protein
VCVEINAYQRHLGVAKLVPEILNGVETNKSSDEKTNKLDTAHAANAQTSHEQPEEPLRLKSVAALVVELGPAQNCGNSTAKQHGVEQNKAANGGVGVLAKDHERDEPDGRLPQVELLSSVIGHWDTDDAEEGIESAHESVVEFFGVFLARLELECTVVAGEDTGETNEHLAERGVDVEVVFMLDVVASEFAETSHLSVKGIKK